VRLVRISHLRCSDYDRSSWMIAPKDWDDEKIEDEIYAAQDAYLKQYQVAKLNNEFAGPPYPGYVPKYADCPPDMTIAEVQADHLAKMNAYNDWKKKDDQTKRTFESFLTDQGFETIWHTDEVLAVECDWGHRHGMSLEYGNDKELNGMITPAQLAANDLVESESTDDELS
jgi:hypothetical protein